MSFDLWIVFALKIFRDARLQFYITMTYCKVIKRAKIRNPYNQAPHLTQDTYGKVTMSQLDTTNESQEVR